MHTTLRYKLCTNKTPCIKNKAISGLNIIYVRQFFWNTHFSFLSGSLSSLRTTPFVLLILSLLRKLPQLESIAFSSRFPHVIVTYIFLSRKVITQDVIQSSVCSHLISSLNLHSASLDASHHTDFVWRQICHPTEHWENIKGHL